MENTLVFTCVRAINALSVSSPRLLEMSPDFKLCHFYHVNAAKEEDAKMLWHVWVTQLCLFKKAVILKLTFFPLIPDYNAIFIMDFRQAACDKSIRKQIFVI